MTVEVVSHVEISEDGLLILRLNSAGKPSCQYVYRAGAGVYWDQELKAFKFSTKNDGDFVKWFTHVLSIVESEMGLTLRLDQNTTWANIPYEIRDEMLRSAI